jgi:hypothetical protein
MLRIHLMPQRSYTSKADLRQAVEQGLRSPTLESAVKLARALGVSVEAFAECTSESTKDMAAASKKDRPPKAAKKPRPRKGE